MFLINLAIIMTVPKIIKQQHLSPILKTIFHGIKLNKFSSGKKQLILTKLVAMVMQ